MNDGSFLLLCHVDIAKASFTEWLTEIEVGDFPLKQKKTLDSPKTKILEKKYNLKV